MPPSLGILAIGSELLDGRVVDTNSKFIADRVNSRGIRVTAIHTCDDVVSEITSALDFIFKRTDIVLILGGLGPTDDDLTREAVASFAKISLVEDLAWLERIKEIFKERKRPYDESNRKQALIPEGSSLIPNGIGTASGFRLTLKTSGKTIISLPGVPSEMKEMFEQSVFPFLQSVSSDVKVYKESFRIFGLPEATVGGRIKALKLPSEIKVSYRATFPEIQVVLSSCSNLTSVSTEVAKTIGEEYIFSRDLDIPLEGSLHELLLNEKTTISTAESCTGGLIAKLLTDTPGASSYYIGGVNAYSNKIKEIILSVSATSLASEGAVSDVVAREMAMGVQSKFGTTYGLSITGVAGPDGGTSEKPVGTFYIGFASGKEVVADKFFYPGTRSNVRAFSAFVAIDLVRRKLLKLPPLRL